MSAPDDLPDMEIVSISQTHIDEDDWDIDIDGPRNPYLTLGMLIMGVVRQFQLMEALDEEEDADDVD